MMRDRENLGHYKIRSVIGTGGMGEVYLAHDTRLKRKVALKILPEEFSESPERLARFEQEAFSISALNHPNILTVYEFGKEDDIYFLATEYVEGETLRNKLSGEIQSFYEILEIARQIAFALSAAHSAGIMHRDIKPENVMIRPDGIVKVLDFGLAKLSEEKTEEAVTGIKSGAQVKTQSGVLLGTVFYMSPEQAEGKDIDTQTDIWSLGVILYEMLTGRLPFAGATVTETLLNILTKTPLPVSEINRKIPFALEHIVSKSLKKNKSERYQTAKDLLLDLKNLQKRLDFEAEQERSELPSENTDEILQDFELTVTEKIPVIQPNNLSAEFTPIVGREKETAEICGLLKREDLRLLTLTGVGGTGKTSLAKTIARRMLADFRDGAFFVELAPITNTDLVAPTIAQALNIKEAGGKPILEVLKTHLSDKRMLLVVDNFEQVVEAAPQIAEMLFAARELKILVTSRTLLRLSAEREFIVPPLALPDEYERISLEELSNYEAIKLFVQRATQTKPSFALSPQNAQAVAEICRRLEGLPLAIELAAAHVKFLSPQAIQTKLENRLKLLTGGARDLPARQQTMRGAIEWSYELLNEAEKCLFRRLAVFVGGFTLESAEAIGGGCRFLSNDKEETAGKQPSIDTYDGVTSLVEKSLLAAKEQENGEMRFRMLEVVREYALEALETSGEAEHAKRSHAECFLALGERAEHHLKGSDSVKWLDQLEDEHDNLRAALQWLLENNIEFAARLAASIRLFWFLHSHLTEGSTCLKTVLECSKNKTSNDTRFKLLNLLGTLSRFQGDYQAARAAYEEGLVLSKAANDLKQIAESNSGLGLVVYQQGDTIAARRYIEEGLKISRRLNDLNGIAAYLNSLGDIARTTGDNSAARALFEEALEVSRRLGNKQFVSTILANLAAVTYIEGDLKSADSHFREALIKARELGNRAAISYSLDGFAALAAKAAEPGLAATLAGSAQHLRESIGFEIEPADRHFRDNYISALKTKMSESEFTKSYEQGCNLKLNEAIAQALSWQGFV
jgi:non-specific serine/threonine protein kinase